MRLHSASIGGKCLERLNLTEDSSDGTTFHRKFHGYHCISIRYVLTNLQALCGAVWRSYPF